MVDFLIFTSDEIAQFNVGKDRLLNAASRWAPFNFVEVLGREEFDSLSLGESSLGPLMEHCWSERRSTGSGGFLWWYV